MCELCNRANGWDERLIGNEQYVDFGRFGKMRVTLSLRGDDIPVPEYGLVVDLEIPQRKAINILAEINERIYYCPICGRKLEVD